MSRSPSLTPRGLEQHLAAAGLAEVRNALQWREVGHLRHKLTCKQCLELPTSLTQVRAYSTQP